MLPRDWLIRRSLARHGTPQGARLARVLDQLAQSDASDLDGAIAAIEAERVKLCRRTEPLADGSLGEPGHYDAGISVSDACRASKPPKPCLLMYWLVRELKPIQILELGTNLGVSAAYAASAQTANGLGTITTLDASPYRIRVARELHRSLGLRNVRYVQGFFDATLPQTLRELPPVDFAFIDGHHQYRPTLDYADRILAQAAPDALLVFDDIRWSEGMKRAWRELARDPRFHFVLDLHELGVCARVAKPLGRRYASPRIYQPTS
jgi:predicted O-methyltransferase YrrM